MLFLSGKTLTFHLFSIFTLFDLNALTYYAFSEELVPINVASVSCINEAIIPPEVAMFKRIKEFFRGETLLDIDAKGMPTQRNVLTATGVLLLEVAGADSDYAPEETRAVFQTMQTEFQLSEEEVLDLLEVADLARDGKKIDEFVALINSNFSDEQRTKILAMAYTVIRADQNLDKDETKFLTQLKFRLQLNDEQLEKAKELSKEFVD